jgi:hypothetical protein
MTDACPLATLGTLRRSSPVDAAFAETSSGGSTTKRIQVGLVIPYYVMWDPETGGNEQEEEHTVTQIGTNTTRSRSFLICEPSQLHAGKRGWR